jgi:hypothetical protein
MNDAGHFMEEESWFVPWVSRAGKIPGDSLLPVEIHPFS